MLHSYFTKVENFGESIVISQIRQNILPPKFCIVQYFINAMDSAHANIVI